MLAIKGTCAYDAIVMLLYVTLSVALDLAVARASQAHGGDEFAKFAVVVVVEFSKLFIAVFVLSINWFRGAQLGTISTKDISAVAIPAGLYAANNWLLLATLEKIDVGVFAVVRETNIVFTALVWVCVFRIDLGTVRWTCVLAIALASMLVQAGGHGDRTSVLLALLLTLVNACATVSNEKVLKVLTHLDINQICAIMYLICGSVALGSALLRHGPRFTSTMFHGFDTSVWCICVGQVFLGLVVSRLLKRTSSVAKGVLSVFRPLVLLLAAPMFTTAQYSAAATIAGLVAACAALCYLKQGPLPPVKPELEPPRDVGNDKAATWWWPWALCVMCICLASTVVRPTAPVLIETSHESCAAPNDRALFCALRRASTVHLDVPLPPGKCSVVSGSGEVRLHHNGPDIDMHETVIRVNDGPAGGPFAPFVGTKETVRFIEGGERNFGKQEQFVKQEHTRLDKGAGELLLVPLKGSRQSHAAEARKLGLAPKIRTGYLQEGHAAVMDRFRAFLVQHFPAFSDPSAATMDPTTGSIAMLLALSSCDAVDAYSMQVPSGAAPYSYAAQGGEANANSWHGTIAAEHELWTRLSVDPSTARASGKAVLPGFGCVECGDVDPSPVFVPLGLVAH